MADFRFDEETLRQGLWLPHGAHRGMFTDRDGTSGCYSCGARWTERDVYAWWPIALRWADHSSWGTHGIELGCNGQRDRAVARVVRLWRLRIVFGDTRGPRRTR